MSDPKQAIVCTVQISSIQDDIIIDVLKIGSKNVGEALACIFENKNYVKLFHGCDTDLKLLKSNLELNLVNIFDTANAYMKLSEVKISPSLSYLSKKFLSVELDKSFQTADWRIRPLPQKMIDYARKDSSTLI